jgi:hypothetical protein
LLVFSEKRTEVYYVWWRWTLVLMIISFSKLNSYIIKWTISKTTILKQTRKNIM